jgi:hypothetical protein
MLTKSIKGRESVQPHQFFVTAGISLNIRFDVHTLAVRIIAYDPQVPFPLVQPLSERTFGRRRVPNSIAPDMLDILGRKGIHVLPKGKKHGRHSGEDRVAVGCRSSIRSLLCVTITWCCGVITMEADKG